MDECTKNAKHSKISVENNLAALIRISDQIINVENDRLRSDLVGLAGWWLEPTRRLG